MTSRERVLTALRHAVPDLVPVDLSLTEPFLELARQRLDGADPWDHFDVDVRAAPLNPTRKQTDFRVYFDDLPDDAVCTEWGVAQVPHGFWHYLENRHPLAGFTSPADLESYPFPDFDAGYRYDGLAERVAELHRQGRAVKSGQTCHIFEYAWYMRGLAQMLVDMASGADFAEALLDRVTELDVAVARHYASAGVDVLVTADDVGTQDRMMMSPATWRRWLKPRLARVIQAAREASPDVFIYYHSDGAIQPIIPDLIEVGVDILNPVQPECMDPAQVRRTYGDRLVQWGTIGTQTTFPFGTPEEMRATVRERIETAGPDGLVLAPTHVLQPDVPFENLVAFIEAVREYRL